MELLDRFASSRDRSLLLELADFLEECADETISPSIALAAVRNLTTILSQGNNLSAWRCLWCLCDGYGNSNSDPLLVNLQDVEECHVLLQRSVVCLTKAPSAHRLTCLKFLTAFMCDSYYRRRMVCDTEGLAECIVTNAEQEILNASPGDAEYAILAFSNLALAHYSNETYGTYVYEEYGVVFLGVGGLRVLTLALDRVMTVESDTFTICLEACSAIWTLLNSYFGASYCQSDRDKYGYTLNEARAIAISLLSILRTALADAVTEALQAIWCFLMCVERHDGQEVLVACLRTGPSLDDDGRDENLLVVFTRNLGMCADTWLCRLVFDRFVVWRRKYPVVAALLDEHGVMPGVAPMPAQDAAVEQDGREAGAAASLVDNKSPTSALEVACPAPKEPATAQNYVHVYACVRPSFCRACADPRCSYQTAIATAPGCYCLRIQHSSDVCEEDFTYIFDNVFGPTASQDELYEGMSEFVQSALDGYNACVFCYGQTGSGKTHTMLGSSEGSVRGVIPRALEQVAARMKAVQSEASGHYQAVVTCVEIYNETIRDLLRPDTAVADSGVHEIKHGPDGTHITGVTRHALDPHCAGEVERIMEQIARNQASAQGLGSLRSAHSHLVAPDELAPTPTGCRNAEHSQSGGPRRL